MNIQTVRFVGSSDIFAGCQLVYDGFCNSGPDCTWGDNTRSLVRPQVIVDNLPEDDEGIPVEQIATVRDRLESLPGDVLIDLEN